MKDLKYIATKLGFLVQIQNDVLAWGPIGMKLRMNVVDSWKKSIKKQWEKYDMLEFALNAHRPSDRTFALQKCFKTARQTISCNRRLMCLTVEESAASSSFVTENFGDIRLLRQNDYSFYCTTSPENAGKDLDFWLRQRKSWWYEQINAVNDVFDFSLSLTAKDGPICSVKYNSDGAMENNIVEELSRLNLFDNDFDLLSSYWHVDKSVLTLLQDALIFETDGKVWKYRMLNSIHEPIGFRFQRSVAPYKVVIINHCRSSEQIFKTSALCDRLRMSLNAVQVSHLYEIVSDFNNDNKSSTLIDGRLDFYRKFGIVFAVIVDDKTVTGGDCPVTIWHADADIKVKNECS